VSVLSTIDWLPHELRKKPTFNATPDTSSCCTEIPVDQT
jgi:hypothetical protein